MRASVANVGRVDGHDASDLWALRAETLNLIGVSLVVLAMAILGIAAVDPATRRETIWLIVLPLFAGVGAVRLQRLGLGPAAILLISTLALAIVAAALVYPDSQMLYAFPLLVIIGCVLIGDLSAFAIAALISVVVTVLVRNWDTITLLGLHAPGPVGTPPPVGTVLFLVWCTSLLSWLASRPIRTAIDWAWRSYLMALRRTEELRDRQAELGRLAKSLNEACIRLELMNGELDRARRSAEEARQLKAEFAATISHELRTPLNLIIGFTEMMMASPRAYAGQSLPEHFREDLEAVHRNACHISRLINDVLDLSQIEAQRMALERSNVTLRQIVDDAVATVASLLDRLGLTITVEVPEDLPPLYVDARRVGQILINLLNNAARYTDRGGVTVRATCGEHDVVVAVADTGAGIAPEDLPYVFHEFHQVGRPDRRRGGSGLGLAVCKRFAEMHGGWMWAESELGHGSTFYFSLPLSENVLTTPLDRVPATRSSGERTVVVLDREPDTARVFQRYLDGYHVAHAANVRQLRKLAALRPVHALVVTDAAVADWREVQNGDPRLRNLPVYTCSLSTARLLATELGVAEYLTKPVSLEHLATALRRHGRGARDILIVEDDPEMARLLTEMVGSISRRSRILHAGDGMEALKALRAKRPDLVLLDLLMPQRSGYEIVREMKEDATLRDVPIIVISAKGARDETVRASTLGLSRADGLTVGELMKCLQSSLDALLDVPGEDNASALNGGSRALPAWRGNQSRRETTPKVAPVGLSRR